LAKTEDPPNAAEGNSQAATGIHYSCGRTGENGWCFAWKSRRESKRPKTITPWRTWKFARPVPVPGKSKPGLGSRIREVSSSACRFLRPSSRWRETPRTLVR